MFLTFNGIKKSVEKDSPDAQNTGVNGSATDESIVQNLDANADKATRSRIFRFTTKKSRMGCITCKIRKKRCSQERPICADCRRLGKNCVWATDEMTNENVKQLRRKVEEEERRSKRLKRCDNERKIQTNKTSTSPVVVDDVHNDRVIQTHQTDIPVEGDDDDDNDDNELRTLDTESHGSFQTPVSTNLANFPAISANHVTSPRFDSLTSKSLSPFDNFQEFQQLFEMNIRNNYSNSPKLQLLEDEYDDSNKKTDDDTHKDNDNDENALADEDDNDDKVKTAPGAMSNEHRVVNTRSPSPFNLEAFLSTPNMAFEITNVFSNMPSEITLDPIGATLFDYYKNKLSNIVSIVPAESNYYTNVFLPMAMVNKGVLYSIMAWAGYHMGGDFEREGTRYMDKALDYIKQTPIGSDSDALQRLASLLIMCAAEICKGDVTKWPVFLQWASKIIKDRGGLYKFRQDKEQHWLISSFAYHDILASSASERGTYFPVDDYDKFIVNCGFGVDPLQGIVKPLFNIIGEISTLATEAKRLLKISSNSLGDGIMHDDDEDDDNCNNNKDEESPDIPGIDTPDSVNSAQGERIFTKYSSLLQIMEKASALENKINIVKPDPSDLSEFGNHDLELQLTLFELFQFTAKLHLRQSVLRLNPSSLETQFILCELLKCLDIVLRSPVEASLCFPMFIAGMNCTTKKDRRMMLERFNDIIQRYSFKNLERAKTIMEQVWMIDPSGTKCVDWYEIVKRLGWDLSFA